MGRLAPATSGIGPYRTCRAPSPTWIEVVEATGPRRTDRRTRTSYAPDRPAEQREIDDRFGRDLHFLGDWHTHLERTPRPSCPDISSLDDTVRRSVHAMLAFVLVVVGQAPAPDGRHVSLFRGDGVSIC
ncbi:Mov34/MPN/PAD-1 family protein [Bradyrhizobium sp. McL0616]|uniref:Mov34/MPN/PAD-1 family protein n=1 Tax=Bradyrhizobium sp. McL0616 TaxID=3415674 RepID=UPI003CF924D6